MLDVGTCTEKANGSMAKQRKKKKTFDLAEEIVELAEAPAVDQTCACSRCWCLTLVPRALLLLQLASGLLYKPACLRARGPRAAGGRASQVPLLAATAAWRLLGAATPVVADSSRRPAWPHSRSGTPLQWWPPPAAGRSPQGAPFSLRTRSFLNCRNKTAKEGKQTQVEKQLDSIQIKNPGGHRREGPPFPDPNTE